MGDFNPCECVSVHDLAMRRLLNMLRNSQAECTDNECFEPALGLAPGGAPSGNLYVLMFAIGLGLLLYVLRPRQQEAEPLNKPLNPSGSNHPPPTPPIN